MSEARRTGWRRRPEVTTRGDGKGRGNLLSLPAAERPVDPRSYRLRPESERAKLDRYSPVRNITPEYPPILMVHGTNDDDVPYQESADMAAALKAKHVPLELITVENGGHGLGGARRKGDQRR